MLYFKWLQKDNPTGIPDHYPELKNRFETSVPGVYCIGDLTGRWVQITDDGHHNKEPDWVPFGQTPNSN